MKIGIIGAMQQEISLLRDRLTNATVWQRAECKVYSGQLHGVKVALVKSGIGKVSAALGTTLLLDHFKPALVINTGSTGSLVPSLNIGDIIVSQEVRYYDVDVTAFGYELGQMAQCPASFAAAPSLIALAEAISDRLDIHVIRGLVVSGDTFINSIQNLAYIRNIFPQALSVEMEATAIAHICYRFAVPFVVVRAVSDVASQISHLNFKEFLPIAVQNSSKLVEEMVQSLSDQQSIY